MNCKRFLSILLLLSMLLSLISVRAEEDVLMEDIVEEENLDEAADDDGPAYEIPDQRSFTPAYGSPYEGKDETLDYWTLPMDITDEEAVWKVLMQPVTVLNGKMFNGNSEKVQIVLRKEPDDNSEGVGVATCETQGVHVLERGDEWSLIECYSSSFHDSKVINWNALVQGYVQTKYLKEITPNQEMGMVIDKLTQRLYLFKDGKLFTTLLVSTGVSNAIQPYNETRSGEFLLTSKVGDFKSDNMTCRMALRFNSGDLLHEVPYVYSRTDAGYKKQETALGTRASHGCIRVQRKKTPEGVNMEWIYKHHKKNTKLIIWEDWQGRQIPVPADDTVLYRDPDKPKVWHRAETCFSAKDKMLEPFPYLELDLEENAGMTACPYCCPERSRAEIAEINALYAPGGDHDELMTQLRQEAQEKRDRKKERELQKQQKK